MSEEEKKEDVKQSAAPEAAAAAEGLLATLKTNRKAQYALGAIIVAVVLAVLGGGGDGATKVQQAAVSIGQSVTVENPNGGNSQLTVAPGMIGASDPEDTESNVCLVKGAAKGTIEEEQVAGMLAYVKVKMTEGECQGKSGWTSKINIK
jgi:hypothetical protein